MNHYTLSSITFSIPLSSIHLMFFFSIFITHYTLSIIQYSLFLFCISYYIIYFYYLLFIINFLLSIVYYSLFIFHYTLSIINFSLFSIHYAYFLCHGLISMVCFYLSIIQSPSAVGPICPYYQCG